MNKAKVASVVATLLGLAVVVAVYSWYFGGFNTPRTLAKEMVAAQEHVNFVTGAQDMWIKRLDRKVKALEERVAALEAKQPKEGE